MERKGILWKADEGEIIVLARQQYERGKPLILDCRQIRNAFQIATAFAGRGAQVRSEQHKKIGQGNPKGSMYATLAENTPHSF